MTLSVNIMDRIENKDSQEEAVAGSAITTGAGMDLLRFTTAGSVDDGKSTLIGRLLFDSKSMFDDQLEALELSASNRGEEVNLALVTDGLRAEREQGITIDVAYRYFATPRRKFIIADTPGHEQYTRNMVTGASSADLAIVLIDARKGVLTQSRRHAFLSSLLQIPQLVVAINKMDLVNYSGDRFNEIVREFRPFSEKLDVDEITFIPISALKGDNIVHRSKSMPWYRGDTLLHHLEHVQVGTRRNDRDFRFPVQYVIRPDQDYRGFAGRVESGMVAEGDSVVLLPSGQLSTVISIDSPGGPLARAVAGQSVILRIADEMDLSRGDMLVKEDRAPVPTTRFRSVLCWMNSADLVPGRVYQLMHTTRTVSAVISRVHDRYDANTYASEPAETLALNEIGHVEVETAAPVFPDDYKRNQATGSFILIDPDTNATVAAGMIRMDRLGSPGSDQPHAFNTGINGETETLRSPRVHWQPWNIRREMREKRNGHPAHVVWLTGVSGAGKTTIAKTLENRFWEQGMQTMLLDGDQLRHGLNGDLGFTPEDRTENIRRAGEAARLFFEQGAIVICAFVSPIRSDRERVRRLFPDGRFTEVLVHCSPETLHERDPKGLYRKAREGRIRSLTGYNSPHEPPGDGVMSIDTNAVSSEEAVDLIYQRIIGSG